jgi:hypothetical protein
MIKKPGKKIKHGKTKEEKDHLNWVASLPCSVCGYAPCEVHHIRVMNEKRDHKKTIPLCYTHHMGPDGIHTLGKKAWREKYGHELDMLYNLQKKTEE